MAKVDVVNDDEIVITLSLSEAAWVKTLLGNFTQESPFVSLYTELDDAGVHAWGNIEVFSLVSELVFSTPPAVE